MLIKRNENRNFVCIPASKIAISDKESNRFLPPAVLKICRKWGLIRGCLKFLVETLPELFDPVICNSH